MSKGPEIGFPTVDAPLPRGSKFPGDFRKNFLLDVNDPLHVKIAVFESNGVRAALGGVDSDNKGFLGFDAFFGLFISA